MMVVSRLLLVVLAAASVCGAQQQTVFLEASLPLKVLVTSPSEVALGTDGGAAVTLTGRQAITVRAPPPVQQCSQLHTSCAPRALVATLTGDQLCAVAVACAVATGCLLPPRHCAGLRLWQQAAAGRAGESRTDS
jgi:hypothetical protein